MNEHAIKYFALNNLTIESELRRVEEEHKVTFLKRRDDTERGAYYAQITAVIRHDAAEMARHYELFYCLEASIRDLLRAKLKEQGPEKWWENLQPEVVRQNAERNQKREREAGVTPRSDDMMSYTNFGELGEIIKANWALFSDMFGDLKAVETVIARLNTLRAPIAHCSRLSEDEVMRLELSLRDWFRLME